MLACPSGAEETQFARGAGWGGSPIEGYVFAHRESDCGPRSWRVAAALVRDKPEYLKTDCALMMEYGLETTRTPGPSRKGCGE